MRLTVVTIARRVITVAWLALIAGLIGMAALTHLATTHVIHGASMEPAIPFGSLIVEEATSPEALKAGDVVTVRADNGAVISHRVTRTIDNGGETYLEIKGDGNRTPDPILVPARAVIGRVAFSLPYLGYLVAMLGTTSGLISLLALVAAWLLLIVLAEQLEEAFGEPEGTAGAATREGSPRGALA